MFVASGAALVLSMLGCGKKADKLDTEAPTADMRGIFRKFNKRIRKTVPDKVRRSAAQAELEAMEAKLMELDDHFRDMKSRFAQLPVYEERLDAAQQITREATQDMLESLRGAAKHAVDMRQHLTEAEWSQIFPAQTEASS